MKYGAVRKFFRGKSRLSSLVINIWSTSQSIGNIKNFLHVYLLLRTAGWAFVLVAGFFTDFTSLRLHISLLIHHKDDWKDKILWRNHAWCQNTLSVFSSPGPVKRLGTNTILLPVHPSSFEFQTNPKWRVLPINPATQKRSKAFCPSLSRATTIVSWSIQYWRRASQGDEKCVTFFRFAYSVSHISWL